MRGLARAPVSESAFVGQRSSKPHDVHLDSSAASSRQPPTSAAVRNIRTAVAAFLGKLFALLTALVIGVSFPQVSHASIDVADVKSRVEWAQLPSVVSWNSPPTHSTVSTHQTVLESMAERLEEQKIKLKYMVERRKAEGNAVQAEVKALSLSELTNELSVRLSHRLAFSLT